MEQTRVAVVGGTALVRSGLVLQLRLRRVAVAAQAAGIRELDLRTVDRLVLVGDPRADAPAVGAALARGIDVVALCDGPVRGPLGRPVGGAVGPVRAGVDRRPAGARQPTATVRPAVVLGTGLSPLRARVGAPAPALRTAVRPSGVLRSVPSVPGADALATDVHRADLARADVARAAGAGNASAGPARAFAAMATATVPTAGLRTVPLGTAGTASGPALRGVGSNGAGSNGGFPTRPAATGAVASRAGAVGPVTSGQVPRARGRLVLLSLGDLTGIDPVIEQLSPRTAGDVPPTRLTRTERSVHELLALGYSNSGIAEALSLSPKTVEGCVSAVFSKLGLGREDPGRNRRVTAALSWVAAV